MGNTERAFQARILLKAFSSFYDTGPGREEEGRGGDSGPVQGGRGRGSGAQHVRTGGCQER